MNDVNAKVQKAYPDFTLEVEALSAEALKNRLISLQQQLQESEDHKEQNEALKDAQAAVSELSGPYRDVRKAVKLKTAYLLNLLQERG